MSTNDVPFLGLRSVIYPAPDLDAATAAFTAVLGVEPYFAEPFYVGYDLGGYELGLYPAGDLADGAVSYWGVAALDAGIARLVAGGATVRDEPSDVGEGIKMATVELPGGFLLGLIENPNFAAAPRPPAADGPGR